MFIKLSYLIQEQFFVSSLRPLSNLFEESPISSVSLSVTTIAQRNPLRNPIDTRKLQNKACRSSTSESVLLCPGYPNSPTIRLHIRTPKRLRSKLVKSPREITLFSHTDLIIRQFHHSSAIKIKQRREHTLRQKNRPQKGQDFSKKIHFLRHANTVCVF